MRKIQALNSDRAWRDTVVFHVVLVTLGHAVVGLHRGWVPEQAVEMGFVRTRSLSFPKSCLKYCCPL